MLLFVGGGGTLRRRVATRCRNLRRDRSPGNDKLILLWGCQKKLLYSVKYFRSRHPDRRRIEWKRLGKKGLYTVKEAKKEKERARERVWEDTRRTDVSLDIYMWIYIQITVYRLRKVIRTYELEFSNDITYLHVPFSNRQLPLFLVGEKLVSFF